MIAGMLLVSTRVSLVEEGGGGVRVRVRIRILGELHNLLSVRNRKRTRPRLRINHKMILRIKNLHTCIMQRGG